MNKKLKTVFYDAYNSFFVPLKQQIKKKWQKNTQRISTVPCGSCTGPLSFSLSVCLSPSLSLSLSLSHTHTHTLTHIDIDMTANKCTHTYTHTYTHTHTHMNLTQIWQHAYRPPGPETGESHVWLGSPRKLEIPHYHHL